MSDDLTKAAPAVASSFLFCPCAACGAEPAPEPASHCWWCGKNFMENKMTTKTKKLTTAHARPAINAGQSASPHFAGCVGVGLLLPDGAREANLGEMNEIRATLGGLARGQIKRELNIRLSLLERIKNKLYRSLRFLMKHATWHKVAVDKHGADVKHQRNMNRGLSIQVPFLNQVDQALQNRINPVGHGADGVDWQNASDQTRRAQD